MLEATPTERQGSHMTGALGESDGFAVAPHGSPGLAAGDAVDLLLLGCRVRAGHAREGARRYAALLALPGARRPVILSAVGSMPIGMFGLAVLLLAQDATGSFADRRARGRARSGSATRSARSRRGG